MTRYDKLNECIAAVSDIGDLIGGCDDNGSLTVALMVSFRCFANMGKDEQKILLKENAASPESFIANIIRAASWEDFIAAYNVEKKAFDKSQE